LALPVAIVVFVSVVRPGTVVQTVTSPQAWGIAVGAFLATLIIRRVVAWLGGPRPVGRILSIGPLVVIVVLFVVPSIRTTHVNDAFPTGPGVAQPPPGGPPSKIRAAPATAASPTGSAPPSAAATPPNPVPARVSAGGFTGDEHPARGTATTYRLSDGSLVLRFDNFSVQPGPQYDVYLVPGANRTSRTGGVRIAPLKATSGNENYPLPSGEDVQTPQTALIWCTVFSVPIAHANLS
jgi:hypothetical protein